MKEFLRKAFPNSRHAHAKKRDTWQRGFFDSLAEGYEINLLDLVTSGDHF